jgi:hypothetical protein
MDYSGLRESIRTRVQSNNEKALTALVKQLRSPVGVIPFLGAGISAPLKYRQWGDVLRGVASEQLSKTDRVEAEDAISKEDYLRAAGIIAQCLGDHEFQQAISDEFSDDRLRTADLKAGIFEFLPLITAGPVITTNFDRVIEHVFERAGRPFEEKIFGANPDEVIPAIQQNRLVLWKIHGDRGDRRNRVFSEEEYRRHYRDLPELLLVAFLSRPSLFIGCSLETDRTAEVLASIRARHPSNNHYAFVQIPSTDEKFEERVKALRNMGVRPIWYPKGEHNEIEKYLSDLVHALSSVPLPQAQLETPNYAPNLGIEKASWVVSHEFEELAMAHHFAPPEVANYPHETPPYVPIVDRISRGQMVFFLGAGSCMGRLPLGHEFYTKLIAQLDEDTDGDASQKKYGAMEPPRITQHFADKYGREALYSQVNQQLAQKRPEPTVIHWFVATLHDRLLAKGFNPAPPWIVTTNYDDWMEYALQAAGLRYHLFTYRVSDPCAGSFLYQSPSGAVHVVDRPSHFRRLPESCPVLVKLHGGLHPNVGLPISYVFTHRDFVELAGRIRAAIPRVILEGLAERSLLFLGSGLGDDSIESVVRDIHAASPKTLSWAVQWRPRPEKRIYWQELGVRIVDITLEYFMLMLNQRLESTQSTGLLR